MEAFLDWLEKRRGVWEVDVQFFAFITGEIVRGKIVICNSGEDDYKVESVSCFILPVGKASRVLASLEEGDWERYSEN